MFAWWYADRNTNQQLSVEQCEAIAGAFLGEVCPRQPQVVVRTEKRQAEGLLPERFVTITEEEVEVAIEPSTGRVIRYLDYAVREQAIRDAIERLNKGDTSQVQDAGEAVAIAAAERALSATGWPMYDFRREEPRLLDAGGLGQAAYYRVSWTRLMGGYPVYGEGAVAEVNPLDGVVYSLVIHRRLPTPSSLEAELTVEQATDRALQCLKAVGVDTAGLSQVALSGATGGPYPGESALMVMDPATATLREDLEVGKMTHLAWRIYLGIRASPGDIGVLYISYVDATDGQCLGYAQGTWPPEPGASE